MERDFRPSYEGNFSALNTREVLQKPVAMAVLIRNDKSKNRSIRHIGVLTRDFSKLSGDGESDRMIAMIDPDGLAFAAIQGLNEKLDERAANLKKENSELKKQLDEQQKQINTQQATIDALKRLVCASNANAEICKEK